MFKSTVEYKFNKERGDYDITIKYHIINDIVLNKLNLGNTFTVRDIIEEWNSIRSRHVKFISYYCPDSKHLHKAMDRLVDEGILSLVYKSVKLSYGSITISEYSVVQ